MSTPADDRTPDGSTPVPEPTVSTASAGDPGHRWWSAIPAHLGPARTSTVGLAVLFVAIFALYLQVKPETREAASTGAGTVTEQEQPATTSTPPATTEPEQTTEEGEATTTRTPSPTTAPPTTTAPTTTEAPEEPDEPAPPTTAGPTGGAGTTATVTP